MRAAARDVPMAALVAYEAPYMIPGARELPEDPSGRITALVTAGRRADAVRFWMTDVVGAPAEILPRMENSPMWPGLQALAHTLPYDLALTGDQGIPVDYLAKITVPVRGVRTPIRLFKVVLLPAPLRPSNPTTSLRSTHSETSNRMWESP